jgi:carotenoid cleavage dioxygenase-like enzyme
MRDDERGLSRRDLMKKGASGAAGAAAVTGAIAVPAEAKPKRRGNPMTAAESSRAYLTGLASLTEEVSIKRLPVEGRIPAWLSGTLVRNGPTAFSEFGTDPCREIFNGVVSQYEFAPVPNANVTVKKLGDKFVANTEYPLPVIFDPKTLETIGVHQESQTDAQITTAHPHRDPRNGEIVDYAIRVFPNTAYMAWPRTIPRRAGSATRSASSTPRRAS